MTTPCLSRCLRVRCFGVVIELEVASADWSLREAVLDRLPPGWQGVEHADAQRRYEVRPDNGWGYQIIIDDGDPQRFPDRAAMLDALEGDLQLYVAEYATPHLFVHAGVVAQNGAAILLPGRSFAGKSTLVTSLVQAGATYYSDEYAVLDREGRVLPYPRLVSLRNGPHGPARRLDLGRQAPTGDDARTPIPVGLVALLRYDVRAGWATRALDELGAILALSEQTVAIRRRAAEAMAILGHVARSAQVIQGTRGEVADAVTRLLAEHALTRA